MKESWYVYRSGQTRIRIRSKRKPGANTIPKRGTWIVQEQNPKNPLQWEGPCFPEITWGMLKKMVFLGREYI